MEKNIEDFEEVVKLDLAYIDNWTLGLDIKILFETVYVVLFGVGAKQKDVGLEWDNFYIQYESLILGKFKRQKKVQNIIVYVRKEKEHAE